MAALIELKAQNYKRLEAVELKPAENGTIVIAGRNGQGKSSLLDAILAALCGKKSFDELPVKKGKNLSTIEVTIGTDPPMLITRTIDAEGGTKLRVTQQVGKAGAEAVVKKPQAVLDALVGKVAFDPLVFTRKKR